MSLNHEAILPAFTRGPVVCILSLGYSASAFGDCRPDHRDRPDGVWCFLLPVALRIWFPKIKAQETTVTSRPLCSLGALSHRTVVTPVARPSQGPAACQRERGPSGLDGLCSGPPCLSAHSLSPSFRQSLAGPRWLPPRG